MSRIPVLFFAIVLVCLAAPSAFAKGASEATISGPGIAPITLAGEGRAGGEELMAIAEAAGFFPAVFGQTPDPMLADRPEGELGPRYTVEYVMPGPSNELDTIVQDVYPYATPSPVTYVEPDRRFWSVGRTYGGWFVATSTLEDLLVAAGLPESAPTSDAGPSDSPWKVAGPVLGLVLAGAVTWLAVLMLRRRPQAA